MTYIGRMLTILPSSEECSTVLIDVKILRLKSKYIRIIVMRLDYKSQIILCDSVGF
jgi:hypothetical protein